MASDDFAPVDLSPTQRLYRVQGPEGEQSVQLVPAQSALPFIAAQGQQDYVNRRAMMLMNEYGESSGMISDFLMDLAVSDLGDEEILRLSKARISLMDPGRPWWHTALSVGARGLATAAGALIGGAVGSFFGPGGTVAGASLGAGITAVKPEVLNVPKDKTVDAFARWVSGDPRADIGGLLVATLDTAGSGDYWQAPRGERDMDTWFEGAGTVAQAARFLGNAGLDPLVVVGGARSVAQAGATIGAGTPVGVGRGVLLRARTSLEDVERILNGKLKWSDVVRGQTVDDIIRAHRGKPTRFQALARRAANGLSADELARSFSARTPANDGLIKLLFDAAKEGGEQGFVDAYIRVMRAGVGLADDAERANIESLLAQKGEEAAALSEQAATARAQFDQMKASGLLAEPEKAIMDEVLDPLFAEAKQATYGLRKVQLELSASSSIERVPLVAMTPRLREWYASSSWAQQTGVWQTAGMREVNAALRAVGRPIARTARGAFTMNPHGTIRPDEPWENLQVRRIGQMFELESQRLLSRTNKAWTADDTAKALDEWTDLQLAEPIDKASFIESIQKKYLTEHVGLSEDQYQALASRWSNEYRRFVTDVVKKGDEFVTVTDPVWQSDLLNVIPVFDPVTIRRVSRWGPSVLGEPAEFAKRTGELGDFLNGLWKTQAVVKPSWMTRVVGLSEQPRLALAGLPSFVSHPLVALVSSDLFRLGAVFETKAGKTLKAWIDDLDELPFVPGESTVVTAADASRFARFIDPRAAGQLRTNARSTTVLGTHQAEFYLWDEVKGVPRDAIYYKEGWLNEVLNGQLAGDPLAQKFRELWKLQRPARIDEAVDWTLHDPLGQKWLSDMGAHPSQARQVVTDRLKAFVRMTRGNDSVIENLGRLRWRDIADIDPPDALPSYHWTSTFRRPGMAWLDQPIRRALSTLFDKFSAEPSFFLSRRGPMAYAMMSELQRLSSLAKEGTDIQRLVNLAARSPDELSLADRQLLRNAYDVAAQKVKQAVYDLNESSRWADIARFLAPFGNAWQEEVTRWGLLAWGRPHIPIALAHMWNERRSAPFSYTDPSSGQDFLAVPFAESIVNFATGDENPFSGGQEGLSWPLMYPFDTLNIISGVGGVPLPGGGPWLQMGVQWLHDRKLAPESVYDYFFPYGPRSAKDQLFSNPIFREALKPEGDEIARLGSSVKAAIAYHIDLAGGDISKVDPSAIEEQVRFLDAINTGVGLFFGGGAKVQPPPRLQRVIDYAMFLSNHFDPDVSDQLLLERFGPEAAVWSQAITDNLTGQPATAEAEGFLLNEETKPLAERYKNVFWAMTSERARGDFDPVVFWAQVQRGERDPFPGGKKWFDAAMVSYAWSQFGTLASRYDAELARFGLTRTSRGPASEALRTWYDGEIQKLYTAFPAWREQHLSDQSGRLFRRLENVKLLREFISEPLAQELEATEGARAYFSLRQTVADLADELGYGTLESKEAAWLRARWKEGVGEVLRRYPDFRQVWGRLRLEFDPVTQENP